LERDIESTLRTLSSEIYGKVKRKTIQGRIPYAGVVFDEKEIENAVRSLYLAFESGWFAIGKNGKQFEDMFSQYLGVSDSVLTNSGSSANLIAVATLVHEGIWKKGDEILTPATTFPTTVNPLLLYGLKPVLVDIQLPTYTISSRTFKESATSKTKGIMLPHLNGSASYMPEIVELAENMGWAIIEDCCDALGTKVEGKLVGTFGDLSTFSFYGAHHICMGEGGAVASTKQELVDVARSLRDWGRGIGKEVFDAVDGRKVIRVGKGTSLPEDYEMRFTYYTKGFNLKPIDIQAAIGLAQLEKLSKFVKARRRNFVYIRSALERYSPYLVLPEALKGVEPSWFVFPIVVKSGAPFSRKEITDYLESHGIETRPILAGNILHQPAYSADEFQVRGKLMNSDLVLSNGFFVGVYPGLSVHDLKKMTNTFHSFFKSMGIE
jgi:CDP-6-deoxy-D-xylo-4-hexulose-3-dehydrase